jgi:hypothetical protein
MHTTFCQLCYGIFPSPKTRILMLCDRKQRRAESYALLTWGERGGVIRRFGRFPHRNTILGRTSTPEEIEFLKTWVELQPPKSILSAS